MNNTLLGIYQIKQRSQTCRVLYVSYDGLLEPLGQSQILSYLELNAKEISFIILSFEKTIDLENRALYDEVNQRISKAKIKWTHLRYHKSFSFISTSFDILCGVRQGLRLLKEFDLNIIHARSYVSGAIALILHKITGISYIFDIRGLWVDERVEGGLWKRSMLSYHVSRWFEQRIFKYAAHVITLTHNSMPHLFSAYLAHNPSLQVTVIPTCTDVERFKIVEPSGSSVVLGNLGSLGTWYEVDPIFQIFKCIYERNTLAKLLFINKGQHSLIHSKIVEHDLSKDCVKIINVRHSDIPHQIRLINIGLMLYKKGHSRIACSPTRFAEYLSAGIPCIVSPGVGDTETILASERVGVVLRDYTVETIEDCVASILELASNPETGLRCQAVALKYFSLHSGASRYRAVYTKLTEKS